MKNFLEKVQKNGPAGRKNDKTERVTGLGRRISEEIAKWNQMTALRFQTGGDNRHPQPPFRGVPERRSVPADVDFGCRQCQPLGGKSWAERPLSPSVWRDFAVLGRGSRLREVSNAVRFPRERCPTCVVLA